MDEKGGKTPKSAKYINALIAVYGDEVYDVLGMARPVLEFTPDSIPLASLPPAVRRRFTAALTEYEAALRARGLDGASPEAAQIVTSIFEKHGLYLTASKNDEQPS